MTRYGWGSLGGKNKAPTLMDILNLQGLGSNTLCCLDAGAGASYPGTGTTWYDLSGNSRDVTIPAANRFNGVSDGRSPNEYFTHNFGGAGTGNPDYKLVDGLFDFMDPWHTTSANFSVIVGFDMGSTATVCLEVIGTGGVINSGYITKGFSLHRANGAGAPNGYNNFKTNQRMYACYKAVSNDSGTANGIDTGLDLPTNKFLMAMAAIKNGEQHFRVNESSNNTAASWGAGNTNPSTFIYKEYPLRAPGQWFGSGTGAASVWKIGHMAFFDTALSSTQLQNIYNAFKQYRDPSLP